MEDADEIGISLAQVSRLVKAAIKQMNKNIQS
jgi:RNA polymerase sporulation-specific sigma factor